MKSNNYNFIAPIYDLLTRLVFFGAIQRAQLVNIQLLPNKGRVLFIGGGTGFALKKIVELKPNLHIDYVDHSVKMIELSRKKIRHLKTHQVNFIVGNEKNIPQESYDGIISFFYFDILPIEQRQKVFSQLFGQLKTNGIWLFADFRLSKNWYEKLVEISMYSFLKWTTGLNINQIPPILTLVNKYQLNLKVENNFYTKFIFSHSYSKSKLE